ncbi:MAG: porin [Oceanococcus sp.]
MKLKNIAPCSVALLGMLSAPAWADMEMPHLYGRADVSVNNTEIGVGDASIQTNSNASRLGVQNTHALTDVLNVFYRLEYEVDWDERQTGALKARNSVIGLSGGWGSFFVGIHDTPMKKAELKVDLFSDVHLGDIDGVLRGQDRVSDTISYMSPKFGGLQGWLMLIPGDDESENPGTDSGGGSDGAEGDGLADGISASLIYKADALQLGLAYNSEVKGRDIMRASAQYKIGPAQLGALVQQTEKSSGVSEDGIGFVLSAALKITENNKLKLQFSSADEQSEEGVPGGDLLTFGVDHSLAKSTKLYAYYSDLSVDNAPTAEFSTIGMGIRHDFGKKK